MYSILLNRAICVGGREVRTLGSLGHTLSRWPKDCEGHTAAEAAASIAPIEGQEPGARQGSCQPRASRSTRWSTFEAGSWTSPSTGGFQLTSHNQGVSFRTFATATEQKPDATTDAKPSKKKKTSQYFGVRKQGTMWRAEMHVGEQGFYLTAFPPEEEGEAKAARVYDAGCYIRDGGRYAVRNFPSEYEGLTTTEGTEKAEQLLDSVRPDLKDRLRAAVSKRDEQARSRMEETTRKAREEGRVLTGLLERAYPQSARVREDKGTDCTP